MPTPQKSPACATISGSDLGARLAHLQDRLAEAAGERRGGLVSAYHEAVAAGAMHSADDEGVVLLTVLTADGESHVFALGRTVANALRATLIELRQRPATVIADQAAKPFITKPGGHAL